MAAPTAPSWFVVVPVRGSQADKSRLHPDMGARTAALAAAMARDTVDACTAAVGADRVLVVTGDRTWLTPSASGLRIADDPGTGLNGAVAAGAAMARLVDPGTGIAVILGDHPALRPGELRAALAAAAGHPRAVVIDAQGTGTALLSVTAGMPLEPAFGVDSALRHRARGYVVLEGQWPGLRLDVDDGESLAAAALLGLGRSTRTALRPDNQGVAG